MREFLQGYHVNEPTWFYLSFLLILAVFFKFNRVFSVRSLDLALLLSLSPGLLFVKSNPEGSTLGFVWLFVVSGLILARLLSDGFFTRRPRLEQNLNEAGMAFLCVSALLFQTAKVMTEEPHAAVVDTIRRADDMLNMKDADPESHDLTAAGPTNSLVATTVVPLSSGVDAAARTMAILSHLAIGLGLVMVGKWHFADYKLGLAMATMYLLLPCTAFDVGRVNHVLPAAFIVWAFAAYRKPVASGVLMGLACGSLFFAAFLLPLWFTFYWKRGARRFTAAFSLTALALVGTFLLTAADGGSFSRQILGSIDWTILKFQAGEGVGFWSLYDQAYRIPVFAAFMVLLTIVTIWPLQKTLEQLMASSTAIVVATQFWYPHQGGIYVLWYLPLLLMVVFRPKLAQQAPELPLARAIAESDQGRNTLTRGTAPRTHVWQ